MPLSRYQIRNEYGLAEPELYRAADKDDPEALLEGVAMAGLVGVLRQLGDLAEFAAEIFHDLHEEVMVTAARGHSLIVRVQQLESEFPAVEKAFLSQTSHSSFLYNPGTGWHPKMHVEQSLIMRGDLPRFVMDSYEECRGPPRLFLLDKFDVAGAGACLKRYTDPSFFKLEAPSRGISSKDIQREKKIRKPKKKGSRWRNGETPEVLPMSHAKLHQLFLEERIENGITDPARRVKLRRRLNGFPFDIKSGKSYMDRFLKSPSPDHIEVHDIPVDSSPSPLPPNSIYEPLPEIDKINTTGAEKDSTERPIRLSPAEEGTHRINSPVEKLNEIPNVKGLSEVVNPDSGLDVYNVREPCFEAYNVPSTPQAANTEKVIAVDRGSYESVGDYQSDDVASEIENYMDALTTMESEIDTDTEAKAKNNLAYFSSRRQVPVLDVNDDQFQTMSLESQSRGNSTSSDDGNGSLKKGISSFSSSDTRSPSAPSDGEVSSSIFSCDNQIKVHDTSSSQISMTKEDPEFQAPGSTASNGATSETADVNHCSSNLINQMSDPNSLDLTSSHISADSTETVRAPISHETHKILSSMSLNTAATNDLDQPEKDDSPSKVSENDHLMNEFGVDNHGICQSVPENSGLFSSSNSKDESSLEVVFSAYKGKADCRCQNSDGNVVCMSCPIDPSITNEENSPASTDDNEKLDEFDGEGLNLKSKTLVQSDLADISLSQGEDSSPETSDGYFSLIESGPVHPNATVEVVTEKSYKQSLDETGSAENYRHQNSDNGQLGQQRSVSYFAEEHHLDPVVSDVDEISSSTGETTLISIDKKDILSESDDHVISEVIADLPSMPSKQGSSVGEGEYFERSSDTEETAVMREAIVDLNPLEADSSSKPSLVGGNYVQLHLAVPFIGAERESIEMAQNATSEKDIPGELTDYVVSDSPLIQSKEGTAGSEQEHFERLSETEDDALMRETGCDSELPDMDSMSKPSCLGENVQVHLEAPSVGLESEGIEDADGSIVMEDSLPDFKAEKIGIETEKDSQLAKPWVSDDVHQGRSGDSVSGLSDVDNHGDSGRQRSDDSLDRDFMSEAEVNLLSERTISAQSSSEKSEGEASFGIEKFDSLPMRLGEFMPSKVNLELLTQVSQGLSSEDTDPVTKIAASSDPMLENIPRKPLVSEFLPQGSNHIDVPEEPMDQSPSISSNSFLLPATSDFLVEEMPPLPPLPPVQWRMSKIQNTSTAQGSLSVQLRDLTPLFQSGDWDAQLLNGSMLPSTSGLERSFSFSEHAADEVPYSGVVSTHVEAIPDHGDPMVTSRAPEGYSNNFLHLSGAHSDILPYNYQSPGEEQSCLASVPQLPTIDTASENCYSEHTKSINPMALVQSSADKVLGLRSQISDVEVSRYDNGQLPLRIEDNLPQQSMVDSPSGFSIEKSSQDTKEVSQEANLKEETVGEESELPNTIVMSDDTIPQPLKMEMDQQKLATSTMESPLVWPAVENYDKESGNRAIKLPRPRNPLIDAVVAHDKSKLRKVTDRGRPEVEKVDDRDSILEQIRTKSFNLKPAAVSRPSIQGPKTNLKVAAILEKAKTIRQAFAGSDEDDDDDDSWSDS